MNIENSVLNKTKEEPKTNKKQYSIVNFGDVATYSGYSGYYKAFRILKFRTTRVREIVLCNVMYFFFCPANFVRLTGESIITMILGGIHMQAHQIDHVQNTIMLRKFLTTISVHMHIFNTCPGISHGRRRQNRLNMA